MNGGLSVAVIGAGMGGLAAAAALRKFGIEARVYEQAPNFARVGAGIQMMPNSMKVLRGIGAEPPLRNIAFEPYSHLNRVWDTGEVSNELPMPESLFGAPYLCMHRADLHDALASVVPRDVVFLNKKLIALKQSASGVSLSFADGSSAQADAVVAADGVHSTVREMLFGPENPVYNGHVAYRAVFPSALVGRDLGHSRTKWWGKDRHIVIYYTTKTKSDVYFIASVPEPVEWMTKESWSAKGSVRELCDAYAGFHPDVRAVLEACPECHKWAILIREPLPRWGERRVVLLGDAAHPMTPYMAQGGATAIEDAAILARCVADCGGDVGTAFRRYEAHRKPRTSRIQAISRANTWLRGPETDTRWLYGYDAWNAPLAELSLPSAISNEEARP